MGLQLQTGTVVVQVKDSPKLKTGLKFSTVQASSWESILTQRWVSRQSFRENPAEVLVQSGLSKWFVILTLAMAAKDWWQLKIGKHHQHSSWQNSWVEKACRVFPYQLKSMPLQFSVDHDDNCMIVYLGMWDFHGYTPPMPWESSPGGHWETKRFSGVGVNGRIPWQEKDVKLIGVFFFGRVGVKIGINESYIELYGLWPPSKMIMLKVNHPTHTYI